jgi:hypothetical protein
MSVHTIFTGNRGVLATLAAFHLVANFSIETLGWISAALIVFASLMMATEIRAGRGRARRAALTEEVAE